MEEDWINAHSEWVKWVEQLPEGPQRKAEERWGLSQVYLSAQFGGHPTAEQYRSRIAIA